ncbi:MAG: presqualene diphosphate synthase HpnD [Acidobacteriia bacterium]|nr:presqualene diphosphate synthase HpnD [Terriglobia bacterium]
MTLAESYAFCERVARTQAKNFYYSFLLLSRPQRQAMCAIYAFMRYCDDLSDAEGISDRAGAIARWQADLDAALAGNAPENPVWPAFADAVARYRIPHEYFRAMIRGVSSDLEPRHVQTFQELYDYCYHVASVVGLTIIHIFGFNDPRALELAERCGVAFQLTNILRDVREDAEHGRVYLPAEDLERFGVNPKELAGATLSPALRKLLEFEAERARAYYRESEPLMEMVDSGSRASLKALIGIYSRLLDRISSSGYEVLRERVRVPAWEKLWILARCAI